MKKISRRIFTKKLAQVGLSYPFLFSGAGSLVHATKALGETFNPESPAIPDGTEFDFIIVGSGAGGGPLASNLAKAGNRVLVIEAGSKQLNRNSYIPVFHGTSTEDPRMCWSFFVNHYQDLKQQKRDSKYVDKKGILYPRASTLGGCTAQNAMITLYPDNRDWDAIAQITGDRSWESAGMRKYFERLEKATYVNPSQAPGSRHGYQGWLTTEQNDPSLLFKDKEIFAIALAAISHELGDLKAQKILKDFISFYIKIMEII